VEEMKTFLETEAKKRSTSGELSVDELEAVSGGKQTVGQWIGQSIFEVGIGCIASAISLAVDGKSCTGY
jgi:hypothetical protein